jgi:hypothetical protein
MTNVMAGTRLPIALAIDDEAKYSPSAKTFWLIVTLWQVKVRNGHVSGWGYSILIHKLKLKKKDCCMHIRTL